MAMIQVLTDSSEMPFGKYKGQAMANVPAGYLLWFYDEGGKKPMRNALGGEFRISGPLAEFMAARKKGVRMYVEENMDVLRAQKAREDRERRVNNGYKVNNE